jgi:hypothetical protein
MMMLWTLVVTVVVTEAAEAGVGHGSGEAYIVIGYDCCCSSMVLVYVAR